MNFYIVTKPTRDSAGNVNIGMVRQLQTGEFIWHTHGHRISRKHKSLESVQAAAKRALGSVRFEEKMGAAA